jgi:hypothetical protein
MKCMGVAALVLSGAAVAMADSPSSVRLYTLDTGVERRAAVVERSVAVPAATVGRELSEQAVRPWMIEVRIGNTTTFLDPQADYAGDHTQHLDEGHWILRAQRTAQEVRSEARVIYGSDFARPQAAVDQIRPSMILLKPNLKAPRDGEMPVVPIQPESSPRKGAAGPVASAE